MNESLTKAIEVFNQVATVFKRYRVITFIVILALIYGFLIFSVNSMSSRQPSDSDISAELKGTSTPHIDKTIVDKIQDLQDNSVQVKTLFNNARNNPFSE